MNVLQVNHRYWPVRGGSEDYFRLLSRDLVRAGHAVTVLTTDALDLDHLWGTGFRRIPEATAAIDGARVCRFPVRHPLGRPYWQLTLKRLNRDAQNLPWIGRPLSRRLGRLAPAVPGLTGHLARRTDADHLIHVGNILFDGVVEAALDSARQRGIPCVLTPFPHLGEEANDRIRRDYTTPRQLDLLRRADAIVAQTRYEQNWLAARGVDPHRVTIAPAGPDLDEVAGGDPARARRTYQLPRHYVLFLGPTAADKGFDALVEATDALAADPHPVGLVAVGPVTPDGRARLARAGGAVCHLGLVGDADRNDLLAGALAVALPSRTESLGRTILEGWYYEKPAIAARAGAPAEVVEDGRDGLLVPFGDAAALARAIRSLTADPVWAYGLGRAGRAKLIARYHWAISSRAILNLMERLATTSS